MDYGNKNHPINNQEALTLIREVFTAKGNWGRNTDIMTRIVLEKIIECISPDWNGLDIQILSDLESSSKEKSATILDEVIRILEGGKGTRLDPKYEKKWTDMLAQKAVDKALSN